MLLIFISLLTLRYVYNYVTDFKHCFCSVCIMNTYSYAVRHQLPQAKVSDVKFSPLGKMLATWMQFFSEMLCVKVLLHFLFCHQSSLNVYETCSVYYLIVSNCLFYFIFSDLF